MNSFIPIIKANFKLLILFVALTLLCSQPHAGFLSLFFAPPVLFHQLFCCVRHWKIADKKANYIGAVVIVMLSMLIVSGAQIYHYKAAKETADRLVKEIFLFKASNGRYPQDFDEIGLPEFMGKNRKHMLSYSNRNGKPMLFYADTLIVFGVNEYDFSTQTWTNQYD